MSEHKDEIKSAVGQIQIADEVIAIIAGTAALEIEGVEAAAGAPTSSIAEFFGKKNQSKGVKVTVEDGQTTVELDIAVRFGIKIQSTAMEVQKKVKNAIETMTGLKVAAVDVNISGITLEKIKKEELDELE